MHPGKNAPIGKIVPRVYSIWYIYSMYSIYIEPRYILQGNYTFQVPIRES